MLKMTTLAALAALAPGAIAQTTAPAAAAHAWTAAHRAELVQQFSTFLSISNLAATPDGLRQNADFLIQQLKQRGVAAQLLSLPGVPSLVYGEIKTPGAAHTIVFYAHYDGQPVTPSDWKTLP